MIPKKTDHRWKALVTGQLHHQFKCVPAGLMISRMNRKSAMDGSNGTVLDCVDEVFAFFQKYERILRDDIKTLFG